MARVWNWQTWGKCFDLIHQSDLNSVIGSFGCPEQFRRKKEERATGRVLYENAGGKLCAGNATHSVKHRVLSSAPARDVVLSGKQRLAASSIEKAFDEEFEREVAGRPVDWYKTNATKWRSDCLAMLTGSFEVMREHVGEVVLTECAFVFPLDGMWMTGAIDLVYRARRPDGTVSNALSFGDWKTGKQRPHQITLDHGWQSGIYASAMRDAYFVPFANVPRVDGERHRDVVEEVCVGIANAWQEVLDCDERQECFEVGETPITRLEKIVATHGAVRFDQYPEQIRYVHMHDFIPYAKKSSRKLERPEELAWAKLEAPASKSFAAGDMRGPGWYRVNRSEQDIPRLRHTVRSIVSWVRFGRFPAAPGELCSRCKFRAPCLTDGYKPIGEDKKQLDLIRNELDGFDGLDEQ